MSRPYYEAYDDRYRQVHSQSLRWFSDAPSPIVGQVMAEFGIDKHHKLLEIGCGEGRDAIHLLQSGFSLLAVDVSEQAIRYCREQLPQAAQNFQVADCVAGQLDGKFDFIFAVAVVHMLVEDAHRDGFYTFLWKHLTENGIGLICSMGDGSFERRSDPAAAFDLQERTHEPTGKTVTIAGTTYRAVNFPTLEDEIRRNGLTIMKTGITSIEPDYYKTMYAIVRKA